MVEQLLSVRSGIVSPERDEKGKSLHTTSYGSDMGKSKQNDVGAHKAAALLYAGSASKSCHTGGCSIRQTFFFFGLDITVCKNMGLVLICGKSAWSSPEPKPVKLASRLGKDLSPLTALHLK